MLEHILFIVLPFNAGFDILKLPDPNGSYVELDQTGIRLNISSISLDYLIDFKMFVFVKFPKDVLARFESLLAFSLAHVFNCCTANWLSVM